jgi:hypothetical protein
LRQCGTGGLHDAAGRDAGAAERHLLADDRRHERLDVVDAAGQPQARSAAYQRAEQRVTDEEPLCCGAVVVHRGQVPDGGVQRRVVRAGSVGGDRQSTRVGCVELDDRRTGR